MSDSSSLPKHLTKDCVHDLMTGKAPKAAILQIISIKDIKDKKNMKHKLYLSDGHHKLLWVVKSSMNNTPQTSYKRFDIVKLNKHSIKDVGKVKVAVLSEELTIIYDKITEMLGSPTEYKEFKEIGNPISIPYQDEIVVSEDDVEMNEESKEEQSHQEPDKIVFEESFEPQPEPEEPQEETEDDIYTPIRVLNPMNPDWIIKARVSKKYPVKTWQNARGNGKLLNIELVDRYGVQIQATFFNNAVEKFDQILDQDKVYIFSKGTVKVANSKFSSIKNEYCLTFSPYSEIKRTEDDSKISKQAFNFVNLKEIELKGEGKTVDVIVVILQCSEVVTINLKSGDQKDKRDYVVVDNSFAGGAKIQITLWGLPAKKFNFQPGTVIAFKGLRITTYKGINLNGGDYTGVFEAAKLGLKEERALSSWYRNSKDNLEDIKSLTIFETSEKKGINSNVRLIKEIQETLDAELATNPKVKYYINGHIEMIKNDSKMLYMACPTCKKKMAEEAAGYNTWNCERCDLTTTNPVPTYLLTAKVADPTGTIWVKVYGDSALPIMGDMTPEKFREKLELSSEEIREQEIKDTLLGLNFKDFSIQLRPTISEYNNTRNLTYIAQNVYKQQYQKNNDLLIERLVRYSESKEDVAMKD